jgi:hypothetical protein
VFEGQERERRDSNPRFTPIEVRGLAGVSIYTPSAAEDYERDLMDAYDAQPDAAD